MTEQKGKNKAYLRTLVIIVAPISFSSPEGLLKCHWRGTSIVEVPISFIPRQAGDAKWTRFKTISSSVRDVFRLWWKWIVRGERRPVAAGSIRRVRPEEWENSEG